MIVFVSSFHLVLVDSTHLYLYITICIYIVIPLIYPTVAGTIIRSLFCPLVGWIYQAEQLRLRRFS